jgi:hypothetical protein
VVGDVRLRRRKSRSAVRDVHEHSGATRPSSVEGVGSLVLGEHGGAHGTRSHHRKSEGAVRAPIG